MADQRVQALLDFLKASPTAFHAVFEAERTLAAAGFEHLTEGERWALQPGGRYCVSRNGSALIAFVMPGKAIRGFQLIASHTDSPTFKIKENAEVSVRGHYVQLDTEGYGGGIYASWFDRPLSVAGRVLARTAEGLRTRLLCLDRDCCVIPNVAIHMNREVNKGYAYQAQIDLPPLWGTGEAAGSFRRMIAEAAGVEEKDIAASDLYLYNRTPGTVWGVEDAFVSAGRLDDLECVFTSVAALAEAAEASAQTGHVSVCALFDNEEVGSTSRQGARSTLLRDVLLRIREAAGLDEQDWQAALSTSLMLSADNAHAVHPNHPEYADPVNCVWMNEGVVIKHNANQKYTTDALSAAAFREVCRQAGVQTQDFFNRSDMPGGSTLGNLSSAQLSVPAVDIGLAQLAMHSAWETAGARDVDSMIRAMRAFYAADIHIGDGLLTVTGGQA
ncbi:MAG: M18 family aminopeptidase [Clostridia bacterium]|nr:M18 family aminopeptidase [Clostridia bacterium]